MSDLCWLTDEQMARLQPYFPGATASPVWMIAGIWERVFADLIKDWDNQYLMLDSTLVRAHQQATIGRGSGSKRGASIRLWGVFEAD